MIIDMEIVRIGVVTAATDLRRSTADMTSAEKARATISIYVRHTEAQLPGEMPLLSTMPYVGGRHI